MKIELGKKKEIYTGARCMASGILLGRMVSGLASFERHIETPKRGSSSYDGAENAYKAAHQLQKLQTQARPHLKSLMERLEYHKESRGYLDKTRASEDLASAKKHLSEIAQVVVKTCGKRRPQEGEGDALLQMKTVKRAPRPAPQVEEPMVLPEFPPDLPAQEPVPVAQQKIVMISEEQTVLVAPTEALKGNIGSSRSDTPWAIIAGVAMIIGAAFLLR
jgi:hypothetical protein